MVSASKSPRRRSSKSSTRPGPAICSPPASSPRGAAAVPLKACLETGALAAAEIISHFGARPEVDLKELAGL